MKGLAFVFDPDGYAIEVVHQGPTPVTRPTDCCGFSLDNPNDNQEQAAAPGVLSVACPEKYTSATSEPTPAGGKQLMDVSSYYHHQTAKPAPETKGFIMQQTSELSKLVVVDLTSC